MRTWLVVLACVVAGGIVGGMLAGDYQRRPSGQEWSHTGEVDQWAADNAH